MSPCTSVAIPPTLSKFALACQRMLVRALEHRKPTLQLPSRMNSLMAVDDDQALEDVVDLIEPRASRSCGCGRRCRKPALEVAVRASTASSLSSFARSASDRP